MTLYMKLSLSSSQISSKIKELQCLIILIDNLIGRDEEISITRDWMLPPRLNVSRQTKLNGHLKLKLDLWKWKYHLLIFTKKKG